ncbi:DUF4263 domain-containing protein [Candidatus Uhrbacteria bacterium]|nr:MAG: DUF4263 domain-containing protein [Candidatus Uhrbacteria bacterium]
MSEDNNQQTHEEFLEVTTIEAKRNSNVGNVHNVPLSKGPRSMKSAKLTEIVSGGELHHRELRIESHERKGGLWSTVDKRSVGLTDRDPDEVTPLKSFLDAFMSGTLPDAPGQYRIIPKDAHERLVQIARDIPSLELSGKIQVLKVVAEGLARSKETQDALQARIEAGDGGVFLDFAAAVKLADYSSALARFQEMLGDETLTEPRYQEFLTGQAWMFGTEYSELLDRRVWVRDDQADFMLRRTADGYLEILEIKRPTADLFRYDKSHDAWVPAADLSEAIGQVMKYIEEIDKQRNAIRADDDEDPLKIRARVVMGRDGDEHAQAALRNLNSHLHRIEVLTYDQLFRMAERVVNLFRS